MSVGDRMFILCSCNGTVPLDSGRLREGLGLSEPLSCHSLLCQTEIQQFAAIATGDVVVGCTQEAALFSVEAESAGRTQRLDFVNLRETAGWSAEGRSAAPKMAALLALAAHPDPEPAPRVAYESSGRLLIVGPLEAALHWASALQARLAVTVLAVGRTAGAQLPGDRSYPVHTGQLTALRGWLGAFEAEWLQQNPIDLDRCTRCNACARACPEAAIDASLQIDLDRCRGHRDCVAACGAAEAIDFTRRDPQRRDRFDIVLDLQKLPALRMHQPPQGYFSPGSDPLAQAEAVLQVSGCVGTFEKPRYFAYDARLCAHRRSGKIGCTRCIDTCSTAAIDADGDGIRVEPHLCMGCGACATGCPTGALRHAYPGVPEFGRRARTLLDVYIRAGGHSACVLLHAEAGRTVIADLARRGRGLPAHVIPVEIHHVAAAGLDIWLSLLACGAAEVAVLTIGTEAPQYLELLDEQLALGNAILVALGHPEQRLRRIRGGELPATETALWSGPRLPELSSRATFAWSTDKRTTLAFALEHLARDAGMPAVALDLPRGAPFGTVNVDAGRCTLCLACVGACPVGALQDSSDRLALRLIESRCVQCGLCERTCPEDAIALQARLLLGPEARAPHVLVEVPVHTCPACGKVVGSARVVEAMVHRLAGHTMFAAPGALDRLRLCADCRVVAMMRDGNLP